ncbi:MAG: asparagine synthase-related protein [Ignavibacteria bacterium]|jgi:asparagine synthase (glutamine-hydrolysing)
MSGICGIFNLKNEKVTEENISKMMDSISRLGPDGNKYLLKNNFAIGFQKRIITPQDKLEQLPFEDKEWSLIIAADSRLDNRAELVKTLALEEELKDSYTDSFLILSAFKKWGRECVNHLLGEYIVVIFDYNKNEMICFSDHLRNLPIYYYKNESVFVFATEINGVLAYPETPKRINKKKLAVASVYTIAQNFYNTTETYYDKIYRTESASILSISPNNFSSKKYWEPSKLNKYKFNIDEEYFEQFRTLLFQSVKDRMRTVYPVSSLLSGGLDSSSIVGILLNIFNKEKKKLVTFSSITPDKFRNKYDDEEEYIDAFKDYENIDMIYIDDENIGPFDNIEELIRISCTPFHTSRHYLYTAFSNAVSQKGTNVLFDGVYGEFGATNRGTGYMKELFLNLELGKLFSNLREISNVENISFFNSIKKNFIKEIIPYKLFRFIKYGNNPTPSKHPMVHLYNPAVKNLISQNDKNSIDDIKILLENNFTFSKDLLLTLKLVKGHVENYYMGYEKVKMLYPFLDKRLLEFYLDMPPGLTIKNGYKRYLVRGALEGILPEKIRWRTSKAPFSPDYYRRFNMQYEKAKEYFKAYSRNELVKTFINTAYVNKLLDNNYDRYKKETSLTEYFVIPNAVYLSVFLSQF